MTVPTFVNVNLGIAMLISCIIVNVVGHPEVDSTIGYIQGRTMDVDDRQLHIFLGIPYAEPPVKDKRFKPPVPKQRMPGVFNATNYSSICPQDIRSGALQVPYPVTKMSENCLSLNIYVPFSASKEKPVSVMIWIHGGGYTHGSGSQYDGTFLCLVGNVIVVTLNYRLGALGFLSTGDDNAPGNYGLMDQFQALTWVKENIFEFGGNPRSITMFGESAGASSVTLLALLPQSAGLFQRVIAQSGSALAPWAMIRPHAKFARDLGTAIRCKNTDNNRLLVKCLKQTTPDELVRAQAFPSQSLAFAPAWGPVIQWDFLQDAPEDIISGGNPGLLRRFADVDFLCGVNSQEGAIFFRLLVDPFLKAQGVNVEKEGLSKKLVEGRLYMEWIETHFLKNTERIMDAVVHEYTFWKDTDNGLARAHNFINFMSDFQFVAGNILLTQKHAETPGNGKTFFYLFNHRGSFSNGHETWRVGAEHGDDIPFIFGWPIVPQLYNITVTREEIDLSTTLMIFWTNFAKTGDPNKPFDPALAVHWPPFTKDSHQFLELSTTLSGDSIRKNPLAERMSFWINLVPSLCELPCTQQSPRAKPVPIDTVIATIFGKVRGAHHMENDMEWDIFLGIPYAAPPVGHRRFSRPRTSIMWEGVHNATRHGPHCMQNRALITRLASIKGLLPHEHMSEDCLYLNIYVPHNIQIARDEGLAVMMYIHGGSFLEGTGSIFDGRALSWYGRVIVVTFNYRLGALGFLSTEDESSPGNFGLLDQYMAINWINKNVHFFGGDAERVTVFGQSAGAMSAFAQALSPYNRRLVRRIIAQSGAVPAWHMPGPRPYLQALRLAESLGCGTSVTQYIIECLRNREANDIVNIQLPGNGSFPFPPVIDYDFIASDLRSVIENGSFADLDLLIGTNEADGVIMAHSILAGAQQVDKMQIGLTKQELENTLLTGLMNNLPGKGNVILQTVLQGYRNWKDMDNKESNLDSFINILGDFYFTAPSSFVANKHAQFGGHTYMYHYEHKAEFENIVYRPSVVRGADHGDELPFVFGFPLLGGVLSRNFTDKEKDLTFYMMKYWGNFARFGNPTSFDVPIEWPRYRLEDDYPYLRFGLELSIGTRLKVAKMPLWNTVVLNLIASIETYICPFRGRMSIQAMAADLRNSEGIIERSPAVNTTFGPVSGYTVKPKHLLTGGTVDVYNAIPYASPPVKELRLKPPKDPKPWTSELDGTTSPPICMQDDTIKVSLPKSINIKEDCLYLKVFSPRRSNSSYLHPVLVFIHGGDFFNGAGTIIDATPLASFGNMVVVTFNYRLGPLGFLSTGYKTDISGNYGVLDVIALLKWVQNNIEHFGGARANVTLSGHDSGGSIAHMLLFTSESDKLFHRMILNSGSLLKPNAFETNGAVIRNSVLFAQQLGCPIANAEVLLECLLSKPADAFISSHGTSFHKIRLMPVVDGVLYKQPLNQLLQSISRKSTGILLGSVVDEYGAKVAKMFPSGKISNETFHGMVSNFSTEAFPNANLKSLISDVIINQYAPEIHANSSTENVASIRRLLRDYEVGVPIELTAQHHLTTGSKVFTYEYDYRPSYSELPEWVGASSGDEIDMMFGLPFSSLLEKGSFQDHDRLISQMVMSYTSNFVHNGDPNIGKSIVADWKKYTMKSQKCLRISTDTQIKRCSTSDKISFWTNLLPQIMHTSAAEPQPYRSSGIQPDAEKASLHGDEPCAESPPMFLNSFNMGASAAEDTIIALICLLLVVVLMSCILWGVVIYQRKLILTIVEKDVIPIHLRPSTLTRM